MKKRYLVIVFSLLLISNSFAGAGFSKCIEGVVDCIGKTGEFLEKAGDCIGKTGKQIKDKVDEIEYEAAPKVRKVETKENTEQAAELTVEETIEIATNTTEVVK